MQIWHVSSDNDGYFAGIVLAETEEQAREMAWSHFIVSRPNETDADEQAEGIKYEWQRYHMDKSELDVAPLGDSYFGADGEGHLEIEC